MGIVRKINDELAIAGQITLEDLQSLVEEGFRSVVNLRSSSEEGFLDTEQSKTELLGLSYVNIPTKLHETDLDIILTVIRQIAEMPKPMLLHCDNGIRSAKIALIHVAIKQGMDLDQVFQRVMQLGLL